MANGPNYLDNSSLGSVFSSLLARRGRIKSRERNEAIVLASLRDAFKKGQKNLEEELSDSLANLTENYKYETAGRQELYNSEQASANRKLLQQYNSSVDKDKVIQDYAISLYNEDPNITKYSTNFSERGKLIGDAKALDEQFWQSKLKKAESHINSLQTDPLASAPTFADYNRAYYDAFKSSYKLVKDDPTKKSLVLNLAQRVFPNAFDTRIAELEVAVEEAKESVDTQEQLERTPVVQTIYDTKENVINYVNENIKNNVTEETYLNIIENVNNKKNYKGMTEDDIIGLALGTQVLSDKNLSDAQLLVRQNSELHDEKWKSENRKKDGTLGIIPRPGTDGYKEYIDSKNLYLNRNVFNKNDSTNKYLDIIARIEDPNTPKAIKNILQTQIKDAGTDNVLESLIVGLIQDSVDPDYFSREKTGIYDRRIQAEIDSNGEEARYTDKESFILYTIQEYTKLINALGR